MSFAFGSRNVNRVRTTVHNKVVFAVDTILTIGGDIHFHRVAQAYIVIAAHGVSVVACHIERTRPQENELSLAGETSLLVFINAINRDKPSILTEEDDQVRVITFISPEV